MVLINNLTVDEINAALLHLQRSQNEVVGGEKGTTIQNITITNTGGGSGNSGGTVSQDWSPIIDALESRINAAEKATLELDKKAAENEQIDNAQSEQISSILEQIMSLSSNGITSLQFDATNRYLIIYTEDGNTYDVQITSEPITMSFDSTTNKLTLVMGSQTQEVTLPYINANQKGVAGGVATLDESGRVPYSQLPESAMEFKGEWNASTNTPTLADGVGTNGDFYVCNVGGTVNFGTQAEPREVTFVPNDRVIYNGDTDLWVKLPAGQVISVNGQSGVVELTSDDIPYDSSVQSPSVKDMLDDLEPVDNVTSGVMSPVTSNAVAQAIAGGGGTDIAVYPTLAAAEADLANLNVGDFIATEQGGDGVTDAVTDGDMRAVTSNAVYDKHYLTSADITNQVAVDNMQSVSSNAVAQALLYYVSQSNTLPANANVELERPAIKCYQGRALSSALSNFPTITNFSSAGGTPSWALFVICTTSDRYIEFCTVQYYNTSGQWKHEIFERQKIDATWFGWKTLHSLSN